MAEGPLSELVDDDWVITEAGIECPARDFLYSEDNFPAHTQGPIGGPEARARREAWMPERPDWVDQATWRRLIERGKRSLPIQRGPYGMAPSWVECRQSAAELRAEAAGGNEPT